MRKSISLRDVARRVSRNRDEVTASLPSHAARLLGSAKPWKYAVARLSRQGISSLAIFVSLFLATEAPAAEAPAQAWLSAISGTGSTVGATRTFNFGVSPYGNPAVTATQTITSRTGVPSASCAFMGGAGSGAGVRTQPNYLTYTEPDVPSSAIFANGCVEGDKGFVSSLVFNKPLIAPIFHFNNLDASRFAITGTSTTGAATGLTPIARNNLLDISGNTVNYVLQPASQVGCNNNSTSDPINGACGSIRITAASGLIRSLTLNSNATPAAVPPGTIGYNDGYSWTLSFPTAPLTKQFSPATIAVGETSQLTFSITNPNETTSVALTPLDFTDNLPAGVTLASVTATNNGSCGSPSVTNGAGGALSIGDTTVRATNISVAAGATCTITVTLTASVGSYTNDTANMSSSVGNLVPSGSTTLTVEPPLQPSFGMCTSSMYLAQNQPTALYRFDTASNPIVVQPVGSTSSYNYNAVAFNPDDNYLYAISSTNSILRIGSDGSVADLGAVTNLPQVAGRAYNAGEITPDGSYYVRTQVVSNELYRIDLTTKTATSVPLSQALSIADLAWHNGLLYTVDNQNFTTTLYAINPSSGQVTPVGPTGQTTALFGALFGASNGLYGGNNGGGFYQFDLATGAATLISGLPGSGNNDGAKCATSPMEFPADLAITKDNGRDVVVPGETTYTIVVSNNGPFGVQNALVNDALPSGITDAEWTCGTPINGGLCGAASGTGAITDVPVSLPVGASVTFELTMTVPASFSGDLVNTATVISPAGSPDTNTSNNTATDTDTAQPGLGMCDGRMYLTQGVPTQLYQFDTSNNPFQYTPIGAASVGYNAAGRHSQDGYIYALSGFAPTTLVRIGSDGSAQTLGAVTGLPDGGYQSGEVAPDGSYYVKIQNTNQLYRIDVNTRTAQLVTLSQSVNSGDMAWHNGLLYTTHTDTEERLATINPLTGGVNIIGPLGGPSLFGAMFGASNGVFGASNAGGFYQFDLTTGVATLISNSPSSAQNDGAKCATSRMEFPIDLAITKDNGVTTYTPGLDATYTIVVSNNGPFGVQGARVSDPLPAGVTTASWTCGNETGGALCSAPSGTGAIDTTATLPVGTSVTYTLSMGVPASQTGALTNTATVTTPDGVTDPDTSNNTASDTDTEAPPPTSGACSPVRITGGTTFPFNPFGVNVTMTRTGNWQANQYWTTFGGNFTITWSFSQPVPANAIRLAVQDIGAAEYQTQTPASVRMTLGGGSTATPADFIRDEGELAYASATGTLTYDRAGPLRQAAYMQGTSTRTVTSLTLTSSNVQPGDYIITPLWSRPACLTVSKVSEQGTGTFQIDMTNVVQANSTAVPSTMLTTTEAGTAVSSPAYNSIPGTDLTLSEVIPAGWNLASAVCTDQNAGNTGNPTVIGSLTSPTLTIPGDNVRPQSDIQCLFTNVPGEPVVSVTKELVGESITTNNVAEPGEVLTYRVTITHESGGAFQDFEFIENIPNGASMTRVAGADGFTDPVAGSSTVLLTVPDVPVGGEAVVEIDLTVAAPIPLGVTQIRNLISGGDVPEDCAACSVTIPTPPYTPAYPPTLSCSSSGAYFNTAFNGAGGMKTSGFDDYWRVALTQQNVTGAPPAGLSWGAATIASNPPASYVRSPFGNANWIAHSATGQHPNASVSYDIFYRYEFNLDPAVDPASLDLQMNFYADNSVYQVWVNGAPQKIQSNHGGNPYFYQGFTATGVASGSMSGSWRTGLNSIIVHVKSGAPNQAFMAQITSDEICQPKITLRKVVVNDNDGTATVADFTLRATGQAPLTSMIEGPMGDAAVTNASIPAGIYTLGEDSLPDYAANPYSCSVDGGAAQELADNELTLANGQNAICTVTNDDQDPQLTVDKTGTLNDLDGDGLLDAGETITYSFEVKNTGNVTLTDVTVNDPLLTAAGISVSPRPQTLTPGGSVTFTATYTPTQVEIDAGRVENTATGTGTPPSGPPTESPPDTVIVPPDQTPGLSIEKTGTLNDSDGDGLLDPGETINFSFRVTNTGTVTMTDVTVNDPLLQSAGLSVTPGPQTLAPGGVATFTATYTPTQAEIDAGNVENTATGTGTPPSGPPTESPPDTVIVPPDQTPRLSIEKTGALNDADGDGLIDLGETISYSFRVQNTGTVTMTDVTVNDPLLQNAGIDVTPGPQTLAPGGIANFTATYTPTQADIDAGRVENTATGTGTPPSGPPIESPPDTVIVPPDQTPRLSIEKTGTLNDADGDGLIDLGETISYSFRVQNTGTVTMTDVTVNDPLLTNAGISVTPGPQTLAPGGVATFTATYTPTQVDIDAGRVENTAIGTGTPPSGPPTESPPDTVVVPPDQTPGLVIEKTGTLNDGDGDGLIDLGETIDYSFVVRNAGTVTMTDVTVNDPLLTNAGISVTPGPQTLAPGGVATFTATYTPTQADIDAGRVENTATGTGTPPSGPPTESPPDTVIVPPDQTPALTIEKIGTLNDSDGDGLIDLGETISYSFRVQNTGAVTMTGVTVNDPLLQNAGISVTPGPQTLAPGGVATFTATYTPTQDDIDAGRVENTATGTGTPPSGPPVESPPDTVIVPPDQTPGLTIEKTGTLNDSDGDGLLDPGETIIYSFRVQNTGAVTMTNVTINDPLLTNAGLSVMPGPQTLAPGGVATFTAIYTPTQAEIDAGEVENTATGTGTPPSGPPTESPPDTVIVPPDQTPALSIEKTGTLNDADGDGLIDLGETISYSFRVQNTGTVTMTNVTVNDPLLQNAGISVTPGPQTLAPGGVTTFTAIYTPAQADIDAGRVENTATGTGTPPSGPPTESPPDTVVVPPDQAPALTIEKTGTLNDADGDGLIDLGETISYSFLVRNTGTVTLTGVTVDDPLLQNAGISVTPGPQMVAPRGSVTFTATYTPTQADIDAGRVENTAAGIGTPPSGPPIESPPDTVVVPPDQASGLSIEKTGTLNDSDGDGLIDLGETISYSFRVQNTGAVTLTNVTVNDPLLQNAGISVTPGPQTLAPGGVETFTATYTPTQADIDAGRVENTATGTGTPPSGPPTESPPDTVTVPPDQASGLTIEKTGTLNDQDGDGLLDAGETITYSFLVRNTGAVTMTNVTVNDPLLRNAGLSVTPGPQTLAPGGTATFTATYTPTQAEIDAGRVENTATGTGTPPSGPPTESPPDTVVVPPDQASGMTIEKTATLNDQDGDDLLDFGEMITYSFLVENTGAVTLTNVTVDDQLLANAGVTLDQGPQTLAPGETFTFTATYTPTQADIDTGRVENTATATGTPPDPSDPPVESPPDTVVTLPQPASLVLQKTGRFSDVDGNGYASVGDTLTYTFAITNDGGQTVTDVWPVDAGPTFNGQPAGGSLSRFQPEPVTLAPGQSQDFMAVYTLTERDIENAAGVSEGVANAATASGQTAGGELSSDESTSVITVPAPEPSDITITKVANLRFIRRGEQAPFTIRVSNNSAARAVGLTIIDTMPAGFRYLDGTATVDGVKVTPEIAGRQIRFSDIAVDGNSEVEIRLRLLALSTAGPGEHVNLAHAADTSGNRISNEARAVVEIIVEPVFDCGDIIGKVFDDINRNGYQDEDEPGLAGVRVATVKGWLITTDEYGRFHVACADLPNARIGTNFIMKLDERTLPTGYRVTTENPRVVRLTAGKMTELNFGASIGRVVRLDLSDEAFVPGDVELQERWAEGVDQLIEVMAQEQSVLRLTYVDPGNDPELAEARVKRMRQLVSERWRQRKRAYPLEIETRVEAGQ
jgi:uncharacterized repeat protein (TIGR01451 family)